VAGLGSGWAIQRSQWWQSTPVETVARQAPPPAVLAEQRTTPDRATGPAPTIADRPLPSPVPPTPVAAPPRTVSSSPLQAPLAGAPTATTAPVLAAPRPTPTQTAPPRITSVPSSASVEISPLARPPGPPAPRTAPVSASAPGPVLPQRTVASAPPTPPRDAAPVAPRPPEVPAAPAAAPAEPSVERAPAATVRRPGGPPPTPFEAVLGTILYSTDRKLAIVNGRIVGVGDDVNGARIVEITPASVLLRDERGRMRILTLGQAPPSPAVP